MKQTVAFQSFAVKIMLLIQWHFGHFIDKCGIYVISKCDKENIAFLPFLKLISDIFVIYERTVHFGHLLNVAHS
jgi:hypothetical protein